MIVIRSVQSDGFVLFVPKRALPAMHVLCSSRMTFGFLFCRKHVVCPMRVCWRLLLRQQTIKLVHFRSSKQAHVHPSLDTNTHIIAPSLPKVYPREQPWSDEEKVMLPNASAREAQQAPSLDLFTDPLSKQSVVSKCCAADHVAFQETQAGSAFQVQQITTRPMARYRRI